VPRPCSREIFDSISVFKRSPKVRWDAISRTTKLKSFDWQHFRDSNKKSKSFRDASRVLVLIIHNFFDCAIVQIHSLTIANELPWKLVPPTRVTPISTELNSDSDGLLKCSLNAIARADCPAARHTPGATIVHQEY
jgi:hypothetical protein